MLDQSFKHVPDTERLEKALTEIFVEDASKKEKVKVSDRKKNVYSSTHPTEIVECTLPDTQQKTLFIKYEIGSFLFVNDHRKSLAYEIQVYQKILLSIAMSTPKYYGVYNFQDSDIKILVLEYIEDLIMFQRSGDPDAIFMVARWLGEFHRRSGDLHKLHRPSFIHQYDRQYFLQWPKRTMDLVKNSGLEKEYNWLLNLGNEFKSHISELIEADPVVIHGEFYPQNVCYSKGVIYPLDWQTAALSADGIDFAALTQNWSEDIKEKCLAEYRTTRQSNESIEKFKRRVLLAGIYLNFIWLSYEPEAIQNGSPFIDELKKLARRL